MKYEILKDVVVLYVEDENDLRKAVANTLSKIVKQVYEVNNARDALKLFKQHLNNKDLPKFDLIITDINMPDLSGLDMMEQIREIDKVVPFVITTAYSDLEFLKRAISLGVRGYCIKPMDFAQLLESMNIAVESMVLKKQLEKQNKNLEKQIEARTIELKNIISQLKINSKKLIYEATHDYLTKLFNRQELNNKLEEEIKRYKRYKENLSIIMFDIDNFKNINDTYGHNIGDDVLIAIANISKQNIRSTDLLARWGGEEFLLLLPQTTILDAKKIAEKIRIKVENSNLIADNSIVVTISLGITLFNENDTKNNFLKRVDEALYQAKTLGKNRSIIIS
jgi:diguanylate cyclase (GGDEF)-like protein